MTGRNTAADTILFLVKKKEIPSAVFLYLM